MADVICSNCKEYLEYCKCMIEIAPCAPDNMIPSLEDFLRLEKKIDHLTELVEGYSQAVPKVEL